jgi:hypothetical protein
MQKLAIFYIYIDATPCSRQSRCPTGMVCSNFYCQNETSGTQEIQEPNDGECSNEGCAEYPDSPTSASCDKKCEFGATCQRDPDTGEESCVCNISCDGPE